jgi:hypothetical protein
VHRLRAAWGIAGAALAVSLGLPAPAHAQVAPEDLKEACAASYEQAQTLRRAEKLSLARAQLVVCERTCPGKLVRDCRRWIEEIEEEMPSVVVHAVDRDGRTVTGLELSVDGEIVDAPSAGTPLPLDPGSHRLVLRIDEERHTAKVVLAPREQKAVRVRFSSVGTEPEPRSAPADASPRSLEIPPLAWALGAVGVVGLGAGAVLGIKGHVDRADLRSRCAPNCEQEEVDAIERDWTIAMVAASVGVVATGLAVWIVIDGQQPTQVGIGGRF